MSEHMKDIFAKIIGSLILIIVGLLLILVGSLIGLLVLRALGTMYALMF